MAWIIKQNKKNKKQKNKAQNQPNEFHKSVEWTTEKEEEEEDCQYPAVTRQMDRLHVAVGF